jgi:hypothetical protein
MKIVTSQADAINYEKARSMPKLPLLLTLACYVIIFFGIDASRRFSDNYLQIYFISGCAVGLVGAIFGLIEASRSLLVQNYSRAIGCLMLSLVALGPTFLSLLFYLWPPKKIF